MKNKNIENAKIRKLKISRNIHLIAGTSLTLIDVPVILSYHNEPSNFMKISVLTIGLIAILEFYNFIGKLEDLEELENSKEPKPKRKIE